MNRDTWLETPEGAFAVRDGGGPGRDVLLVHGTGHTLEVWEPLAAVPRHRSFVMAGSPRPRRVQRVRREAPTDWLNAGIDPALVEAFTRRAFYPDGDRWRRRPTMEEVERLTRLDAGREILPARDVYDRVQVPTTFVFAERGLYRDRRSDVQGIARKMGACFIVVEAGHNVHMEQPGKLADVIRDMATGLKSP